MDPSNPMRSERRDEFLRALADDDLLSLHTEASNAAKEGGAKEPADFFPEAEFDSWTEWSLAIEAELDRRRLDYRTLNL